MVSVNIHCLLFLQDINEKNLSLEDANQEQSEPVNKLSGMNRGKTSFEKKYFPNNIFLMQEKNQKQNISNKKTR